MKKLIRITKNIINYFKSIRISTIYKLVGIILFLIVIFWVLKTVNENKVLTKKVKENTIITGIITEKTSDYIIIKDKDNQEYLLFYKTNTPLGSEINANITTDINSQDEVIRVNSSNISVINEKIKNKNADSIILNYFNETNSENVNMRFKNIVDFLIYNEYLEEFNYNDLTYTTKLEILKLFLEIDKIIENTTPGFKESISNPQKIYTDKKNEIVKKYLDITAKICTYDNYLCNSKIDEFQSLKTKYSISWNNIKDLTKDNKELNKWYEIFSGNKV